MTKFTKDPSTHPAHGPLTEERLREIAALPTKTLTDGRQIAHGVISTVRTIEVVQMARQLLASMEQEPVACIDRANIDYLESGAGADVWPASEADSDDVLLYAAPQLPQPAVVPDAIEIDDDFDSAFEHGKAVGWNACRAAMLQGAEPVQAWIPCSERMPKVGEYVLCLDGLDRHGQFSHDDVYTAAYCNRLDAFTTEYYGDHDWMSKSNPTHWAPIPKITAAPQQEVKP